MEGTYTKQKVPPEGQTEDDSLPKKPMRAVGIGPILEDHPNQNLGPRMAFAILRAFDRPATWFRENVVLPNQKPSVYYHRRFKRVPTVDECYIDDHACITEANMQYERDMQVEGEIMKILRERQDKCFIYYGNHGDIKQCDKLVDDVRKAELNYFIKNGDMIAPPDAVDCFMKQKHRMIHERRHGPLNIWKKGEFIKWADLSKEDRPFGKTWYPNDD